MLKPELIQGDCLEKMKLIPDGSVDAVITDPPYGTTACKWDVVIDFDLMWEQLNRIIKPRGAIILFGNEPFSSKLRISNINNLKHEWYWNKINAGNFVQAKNHPLKIVENIMVFSNKKVNYYPQMNKNSKEWTKTLKAKHRNKKQSSIEQTVDDKYFKMASGKFLTQTDESVSYPKNIIQISKFSDECNSKHRLHPTQKPVKLLEYLIKTYTNESETVLDFTMGSGSTGVACKNTNRNFIGIEKDENYFNIAVSRIKITEPNPNGFEKTEAGGLFSFTDLTTNAD